MTKKSTKESFVTTRDIVIPAGTKVDLAPSQTRRIVPFASVLTAVTKDVTSEWTMPFDEALSTGLIVKQKS